MDKFEVGDEALSSVSELANKQVEVEAAIALFEKKLKDLREEHKQISQIEIPEACAEIGLSEFKLYDGTKVSVLPFYSGSIPKDKSEEAFKWLRDNGHGDLIKNTISCDFGRGEDQAAESLKESLQEKGQSYTDKTGVHPQTLKGFAREQIETGQSLPLTLLGIHVGQRTVIKEA